MRYQDAVEILIGIAALDDGELTTLRDELARISEDAGSAVRPVVETLMAACDDERRRRGGALHVVGG